MSAYKMVYEDTIEMIPTDPATSSDNADLVEGEGGDRPDVNKYSRTSHLLDRLQYISLLTPTSLKKFQEIILRNVSNHRALTMTGCNIILILTLICLTSSSKSSHDCILKPHKQLLERCEPFGQVDTIQVRFARNSSYHCYNTKSCLDSVDAEINEEDFVANFIVGLHGFVYVGNGFQCASPNSTLWIELSSEFQLEFNDHEDISMAKLQEIVFEGLRCGKIHHDYQLIVTCDIGRQMNEKCHKKLVNVLNRHDLRSRVVSKHRKPWTDNTKQGEMFNLLDKRRVYNRNYRIFACEESKNHYF